MSTETYELLAMAARFWFVFLAALIVIRGLLNCREDNRKERNFREALDSVGELLVLEDGSGSRKKSMRGARIPVPAEGMIGSGRMADIRIRHADINKRHIYFSYQPGELRLKLIGRSTAECPMKADGRLYLRDNDRLIIGCLELLMVFYDVKDAAEAQPAARRQKPVRKKKEDEYEDSYEESFWE